MELNEQQQSALNLTLGSTRNVFLSGFAGTGKTALLRRAIDTLRKEGQSVRVTSFTGLAAQHLRGITVAKLLGLGLARGPEDFHRVDLERAERNLKDVSHIVVDEISMIGGDYLELMDLVLREATGCPDAFGGIRMIFGGDFMQLPPIRTQKDAEPKLPWAFEYPPFQEAMSLFLTRSMRQVREDETDLLNEFRQGQISAQGREFFESCLNRPLHNPVDLYPLRREVEAVNNARLSRHPGNVHSYRTVGMPIEREEHLLSQVPVGKSVELKLGVPAIILMNDPNGRFVNGSQGIVRKLESQHVVIELTKGPSVEVPIKVWEVLDARGQTFGRVQGLPVQLGWAATIHRAQGMTLDEVVTDISRCWEPGQAYVALSRTRSLQNIRLLSPVSKIKADPVALSYVNHLF